MFKLLQKLFSKKEEKENTEMAEEKNVNEKVETEKVETEEKAKVDEKPTDKAEEGEKVEKTEEKEEKVENNEEQPNDAEPDKDEGDGTVEDTEPTGNGIRIEDLVTKDELAERFAALEAKFDAVIKENGDLKNKIAGLQDKYEDNDFGDTSAKGMMEPNQDANSTFEEYSKKFMS